MRTRYFAGHFFYKTNAPELKQPGYVLPDRHLHLTLPVLLCPHVDSYGTVALYHQQKILHGLNVYGTGQVPIRQVRNTVTTQHQAWIMHQNVNPDRRNKGFHQNTNHAIQHLLNRLSHVPTNCIKMQTAML